MNTVRPMYNIYVETCIMKRMSEGRTDHEAGMVCYPVYKCLRTEERRRQPRMAGDSYESGL